MRNRARNKMMPSNPVLKEKPAAVSRDHYLLEIDWDAGESTAGAVRRGPRFRGHRPAPEKALLDFLAKRRDRQHPGTRRRQGNRPSRPQGAGRDRRHRAARNRVHPAPRREGPHCRRRRGKRAPLLSGPGAEEGGLRYHLHLRRPLPGLRLPRGPVPRRNARASS